MSETGPRPAGRIADFDFDGLQAGEMPTSRIVRMELATTSCALRPPGLGDAQSLALQANNRKVWLNLRDALPHPYTVDDARRWIDSLKEQNPVAHFAIVVDGLAVGGIGLTIGSDIQRKSAEIGYWLGEDYWGRGIATDAVRCVSEYGFTELDLLRIFATPMSWNARSFRVLEKAGFQREGLLRSACVKDDKVVDMVMYSNVTGASDRSDRIVPD
jgi:RimJ/RimL family protein N-acetyltransferase